MDRFDIMRAIKAPFQDPEWLNKTLLGLLWGILGVTLPAIYGAQLAYIRSVREGDERLPAWDDFGAKWLEGFMVSVAGMLYALPVLIVGAVFFLPGIIAAASGGDSDLAGALVGGGACVFSLIATVYGVAVSLLLSAAMTHYAIRRNFGAFFEFREIIGHVRGNTGYFAAWLWLLLLSAGLSTITSVVTGVTGGLGAIVLPAASYLASMMMGHILGQWARYSYPLVPVTQVPFEQPPLSQPPVA